jgi:hypothetical protein
MGGISQAIVWRLLLSSVENFYVNPYATDRGSDSQDIVGAAHGSFEQPTSTAGWHPNNTEADNARRGRIMCCIGCGAEILVI